MPQLASGERCTLGECFELGPGDVGMDAAAETAIGRGDDPLATDQIGKTQNTVGDQLGMLDNAGRGVI